MDILLKNLNDEQADTFQRLARLMNIGVQIRRHKQADVDAALMQAMREVQSEGILNADEKRAFIHRLSKK